MATRKLKRQEIRLQKKEAAHVQKKQQVENAPLWMPIVLFAITIIVFIPVFDAGFVNWDDEDYVLNNMMIRNFSSLGEMLVTPLQGNYHPLTMFSLAINYSISGLEPWSYHLLNLALHLVNVLLVFKFVSLLIKSREIAFIAAALFAIHPMHVESVAWVSERKDVLYGAFFLAGLISYVSYLDNSSKKHLYLTYLWFLCSILSKPAAVIFPLALVSIDLYRGRKLTLSLFTSKTIFFVVSFAMGLLTFIAQSKQGSTFKGDFTLFHNIIFGFYGLMMYVIKAILPLNQAAFYPYPSSTESIPVQYYLSIPFFIAFIVGVIYSYRKNRILFFGLIFFLINLLLVLQFVSVGSAIIADRYTYIPYIGLFIIAGHLLVQYTNAKPAANFTILASVLLVFSIASYRQASVWKNGESLWDQAIQNQPSARAYNSRATLLRKEKQLDKALEYYGLALQHNVKFEEAYMNRGNVYMEKGQFDLAYADYRKALEIKPSYVEAFDNLGSYFGRSGQNDSALFYLNKAISLNPQYKESYRNKALVYIQMNQLQEAINNFDLFLKYAPDAASSHNSKGVCYMNLGNQVKAIESFNTAIGLEPLPVYYLNRGYSYLRSGNLQAARNDIRVAMQGGINVDPSVRQQLGL